MSRRRHCTPADPLAALAAAADALESGHPVPADVAGWLAQGFRSYIAKRGSDLDDQLGLKPLPGGRWETPWDKAGIQRRDRLIVRAAAAFPGKPNAAATLLLAQIRRCRDAAASSGNEESLNPLVVELVADFGACLPGKERLRQIIGGGSVAIRHGPD